MNSWQIQRAQDFSSNLSVSQTPPPPKYVGAWVDGKGRVTVSRGMKTAPLDPWHDRARVTDHCFCWGYVGPECAATALAILADYFRDLPDGDKLAVRLHETFHREAIAWLPESWVITGAQIADFLAVLAL